VLEVGNPAARNGYKYTMDVVRRFSLLATTGLLGIAVVLGAINSRPKLSADATTQLSRAASYFDSTIVLARDAQPTGRRGDKLTISLGYIERMRLGLGEPFRLVDQALHDNRLDSTTSKRVAWALLARLRRGDAYTIDPSALDGLGPWGADGHGATGAAHLALIDRAIRNASDPRAGELAVRLAYLIESGKGTLASSSVGVATQAAALLRDRELAQEDLHDVLIDASAQNVDAPSLVVQRRASRVLRVEQPGLAPISSELRVEAMNDVPALVRALDTLDRVTAVADPSRAATPTLGVFFAARLRALAELQPPSAPITVMLRGRPGAELDATNEESLAGAYAPLGLVPDSSRRLNNLGLIAAAVALRTTSQDTPWFAGDAGPAATDLTAEFGLASVKFTRSVPSEWRPYYLRELQTALRDMHEVYPAVAFTNLHIAFGTTELPDSALAMHDPRSRTLQLPIATSGGTLAHELSHDLDWQTAQRMFAVAGGYSTDRAAREHRGALATSVRGLAEARVVHPLAGATSSDRPAELFARGSDWFTASVLAQQGRVNGFLTAVQDGSLAGYAAGVPSAAGAAGVGSLNMAIDQMTYVPDSVRDAFTSQWADPAVADPVLQVRRVFETPLSWRGTWHSDGLFAANLPAPKAQLCLNDQSSEARARERLLMMAIDARAHSAVWRRARYRPYSMRRETVAGILNAGPWKPGTADDVEDELRASLATDISTSAASQGLLPIVPAIFASSAASCAAVSR
jgi:hypothetical protein